MRRLYDDILASGFETVHGERKTLQHLWDTIADGTGDPDQRVMEGPHEADLTIFQGEPQVIVIDNVADYFYAGTDQEHWRLDVDFPNVAPPWPFYWMEYRAPSRIVSAVHGESRWEGPKRVGMLVMAAKLYTELDEHGDAEHLGWRTIILHFADHAGTYGMFPWTTTVDINADGTIAVAEQDHAVVAGAELQGLEASVSDFRAMDHPSGRPPGVVHYVHDERINEAMVKDWIPGLMYPFFLATSFSHCKNVETERVEPPPKLARKHARNGVELHPYHVLTIEPMTRAVRATQSAEGVGTAQALHIMRGHFKDYRERGLFGRHRGIYWWDSRLRGTGPARSEKGYDIRPPRQESST